MRYILPIIIAFLFSALSSDGAVRLPAIFGDNMVLQRDIPIHFWGWADSGEDITVSLGGKTIKTKAGKNGKWFCDLPAFSAGGPYDVIVGGKNTITLTGVYIGDVWICGGQSNMQLNVAQTGYEEKDSSFLKTGLLRLITIQFDMDYKPKEDVKSTGWKTPSPQSIKEFSAVAWHFGKYVARETGVPVGLISDNLGATAVEAWMSNDALMKFPEFVPEVGPIVKNDKNFDQLNADFEKNKSEFYSKYYFKSKGVKEQWFMPETNIIDWKPIKACGNTWENEADLKDFDGEVWFRTSFDLPENYKEETFTLKLSQIDDYDVAWVNGIKVGETFGKHNHRNYTFTSKILQPKGNVVVVRVYDTGGIGGFTTNPFWGNPIPWGKWIYKKGEPFDPAHFPKPNLPNSTPFSSPGVLFNACIAPLTPFHIKGAIWYQGESNVDRAYEYRKLFAALITDWRKQWNEGDFPFLFVQLANYMDEPKNPSENNWAELREAQTMTLSLPNTGMASAIDIGEAADIHPKNKKDVGQRLGMAAMKVAYKKEVVSAGPSYRGMQVTGQRVIVSFDNVGTGLVSHDKFGYIRGFQLAGADQKFYWAKAQISGNTVVVMSDDVQVPVAVRYAWANNPGVSDLYNREGLPANPFRSDQWKGITEGKVFNDGPRF